MLDESQSKIAELETKTRQLQARHDAFEAKLATSVDQQTVAVRTHFRQELDAAEEVHRSQVESLHQKAVQHVEANASDMAAALQQAFLQMETEKSELVRSYNDQLAAAEAKVSATTKECGSALEQMVTEQQKQREVYEMHLEGVLAAATRRQDSQIVRFPNVCCCVRTAACCCCCCCWTGGTGSVWI